MTNAHTLSLSYDCIYFGKAIQKEAIHGYLKRIYTLHKK